VTVFLPSEVLTRRQNLTERTTRKQSSFLREIYSNASRQKQFQEKPKKEAKKADEHDSWTAILSSQNYLFSLGQRKARKQKK
jgi:hypothetical protein